MSLLSSIPRGPKFVVGVTTFVTIGSIYYSHYAQVRDKQTMREGVQRDKERMRMKRLMQRHNDQQTKFEEEDK